MLSWLTGDDERCTRPSSVTSHEWRWSPLCKTTRSSNRGPSPTRISTGSNRPCGTGKVAEYTPTSVKFSRRVRCSPPVVMVMVGAPLVDQTANSTNQTPSSRPSVGACHSRSPGAPWCSDAARSGGGTDPWAAAVGTTAVSQRLNMINNQRIGPILPQDERYPDGEVSGVVCEPTLRLLVRRGRRPRQTPNGGSAGHL